MVVVCKVEPCPYRSKNGFCRNRVLLINQNGQCGHLYKRNGSVNEKWREPVDEMYMDGYRPKQEQKMIEEKKDEVG